MPDQQNQTMKRQMNAQTLQIRQELTQRQTWDVAENQTLEGRRAEEATRLINAQKEINALLPLRVPRRLVVGEAPQAALGTPVQELQTAGETRKQLREKNKRAKKANKKCKFADHVSYTIMEQLEEKQKLQNNSLTAERRERCGNDIDQRMLGIYCQGYKKNIFGKPATEQDAIKKAQDDAFLEAYLSRDEEKRKPYLHKITQEILDMEINPQMLEISYLEKHIAEVKNMSDRLTCMDNLIKENRFFFETELTLLQREILNEKLNSFTGCFSTALARICDMKGVNINTHMYNEELPTTESLESMQKLMMDMLRDSVSTYAGKVNQICDRVLHTEYVTAKGIEIEADLAERRVNVETEEEFARMKGLGLTAFNPLYVYSNLADLRGIIEGNPEKYALYKNVVDDLYQRAYRAADAQGDIALELAVYRDVINKYGGEELVPRDGTPEDLLVRKAHAKMEPFLSQQKDLVDQYDIITNVLRFFMTDRRLDDRDRIFVQKNGYSEAVADKLSRTNNTTAG